MPVFYQSFCEMDEAPLLAGFSGFAFRPEHPWPRKQRKPFAENSDREIHSFTVHRSAVGFVMSAKLQPVPGFVGDGDVRSCD